MNNKSPPLPILSYTTAKGGTNDNSDLDLTNEFTCITTTDNMCVLQENHSMSSSQTLVFLYFIFHFLFIYSLIFLFLEQLGLGLEVISHTVTSVTIWWCGHNIGYKTWENKVEGLRTNDVI